MTILYVLQQSIYNNNNKWLTADSNINMMTGMLRTVLEKRDWKFKILVAPLKDFADINSYDEIFKHDNVEFVPFNFPVNAFTNRQNFVVKDWNKVLKKYKPDIIWNNITEVSRNIKTLLFNNKIDSKLITTCYWLDAPEIGQEKVDTSISYDWRQFDGFECSDLVAFTCESTKKAWTKNAKNKFNKKYINDILKKSVIWDFGYSSYELNSEYDEDFYREIKNKTSNKQIILFLNRLSGINYTHHEEFIEAVNMLAKERDDFVVIFTNPSQKYSWDSLRSYVDNLVVLKEDSLTRGEYSTLLKAGNISVHLFEKELYGGCAHRESIESENIVVTTKVNEYLRIQGKSYKFYCTVNPESIKDKLSMALDTKTFINVKDFGKIYIRNSKSSFEEISIDVINNIENIGENK